MLKLKNEEFDLLYKRGVSREHSIELCKIDETKKISIISDSMFHTMIYNENRIKYACRIISFFVDVSYEELLKNLRLQKSDFDKKLDKEKNERGDFVAEFNGTSIGIEINNNDDLNIMERNMEYAHREYAKKVDRYNHGKYCYKQIIQININNFSFKGKDEIYDVYVLRNEENVVMSDKIIFIQIYIPNLVKKCYDKGVEGLKEEERFLLVLTESDIKTSYDLGGDIEYMKEYIEDADNASRDEELLQSYDKEWALKDQGIREGYDAGVKEIARIMLSKGYKLEEIKEITGLSIEDADNISKDEALLQSYDKKWALKDQGIREGYEAGVKEIAKKMKEEGIKNATISKITDLSIEEIENL